MRWRGVYELCAREMVGSFPSVGAKVVVVDYSWYVNNSPSGISFVNKRENFWSIGDETKFSNFQFEVRVGESEALKEEDWVMSKKALRDPGAIAKDVTKPKLV